MTCGHMHQLTMSVCRVVILLILFNQRGLVDSSCPNDCNGHGKCNFENKCICGDEFFGPDCSNYKCPLGNSWIDKAVTKNVAHSPAECSRKGLCDRSNGKCMCFDGYEGDSCQRQSCNCNDRGTCLNIGLMYERFSATVNTTASYYSVWDKDQTTSCICDFGFTGAACELRMCPKGVDPLTFYSDYRSIILQTTALRGKLGGMMRFIFNGQFFNFPASARKWTSTQCKNSFESLPNIAVVKCSRSNRFNGFDGATYNIQFRVFPTIASENNIYINDGNPPITAFYCDTSLVTGVSGASCTISDVASADVPSKSMQIHSYNSFTNMLCMQYTTSSTLINF